MNVPRDPDAVVLAWLEDLPATMPDAMRRSIANSVRSVEQRRGFGIAPLLRNPPWRAIAVAFSLIVLVAVGGFLLWSRPQLIVGPPSVPPTESQSPTPNAASPAPTDPEPTDPEPTATSSPEASSGPPAACVLADVIGGIAPVVYSQTEIASTAPTEFKSGDLFLATADGSWQCQLTQTEDAEIYPTWSPDGTQIAFERVRRCQETVDVVVLDLATGEETLIGHGDGRFNQLAWSTSGQFLRLGGATFCWPEFSERVFEVATGTQALPPPPDGGCLEGETELECNDRRDNVEGQARGAIYRFPSAQGVEPGFGEHVSEGDGWGIDLRQEVTSL
jgi:WD40-like Beta Propeller Repeat